nr:ATP synthase F0 subunit 8 [Meteorus sp. 2 XHS-2023a]
MPQMSPMDWFLLMFFFFFFFFLCLIYIYFYIFFNILDNSINLSLSKVTYKMLL